MLLKLPEDIVSHVVGFLTPGDFYAAKTAVSSGLSPIQRDQLNCIYWWRDGVQLGRAVLAKCPTLVRWIIRCDQDMEPEEVVAACDLTRDISTHIALYTSLRIRWASQLSPMLEKWIETSNTPMFNYQVVRCSQDVTIDALDLIYTHDRWIMLATAFHYAPHIFVRWAFGNYRDAADAELISNMRFVMYHLTPGDRVIFTQILRRYHDWLWLNKLDRAATLQTIASLHSLENVISFDPITYFQLAVASPIHDFLEYLLLRGLEVEPSMMQQTHDLKKLRLLMSAQFVQKYYKIMVMILVLVAAIIFGIFTRPSEPRRTRIDPVDMVKIENLNDKILCL